MNTQLENLKIKLKFKEMMDEGGMPTGANLRRILRPLCAQKLLFTGKASSVLQVYDVWKTKFLKKITGLDIEVKPEKDNKPIYTPAPTVRL